MSFLETLGVKNLRLRRLVALLVVAYPALDFIQYLSRVPKQRLIDLFVRYVAARLLAAHGDLYSLPAQRAMADQIGGVRYGTAFSNLLLGYTHPVSDTVFDIRYVPFQFPDAKLAFTIESAVLYGAALLLLWLALKPMAPHVLHLAFPILLFALFLPARSSLGLGQSDLTILFLLALSFWAATRNHEKLASVALAFAILNKLTPAVFMLYWLWKREWRLFSYTAVTVISVILITLPFVGLDVWTQFATQIFPALSTGTAYSDNQTLPGLINRLVLDPRFSQGLQSAPSLLPLRLVTLAAQLAFVGVTLWFTRGRLESRRTLRFALEFSAWLTLLLIISPIAWDHYFTWLLIPFTVLLATLLNSTFSVPRSVVLVGLAAVALWLVNTPIRAVESFPELWERSPLLYGSLVLLGLVYELLESRRTVKQVEITTSPVAPVKQLEPTQIS